MGSEQVMVPDNMVGLIIGRGGEQITRLQAESGCKIQMSQDGQGSSHRMCTLTGTTEAISIARNMIEAIIDNEGNKYKAQLSVYSALWVEYYRSVGKVKEA